MSQPCCLSTDWVTLHTLSGGAENVCETGSPAIAAAASTHIRAMAPSSRVIGNPPIEMLGCFEHAAAKPIERVGAHGRLRPVTHDHDRGAGARPSPERLEDHRAVGVVQVAG